MANYDDLKLAVEGMSGGMVTIIMDDMELPSFMCLYQKGKYKDVLHDSITEDIAPAFIVNGVEYPAFYWCQYMPVIKGNRAYSLPFMDAAASINHDNAALACKRKGPGWHMGTAAEYGWIANKCMKVEKAPRGNTNYGSAHGYANEKGVPVNPASPAYTYTGSGPETWCCEHDRTRPADFVGNKNKWILDYRTVGGEIQVIPNNNAAALQVADLSADSTHWKAILDNGDLVTPGTVNTLKWDCEAATPSGIRLAKSITYRTNETTTYVGKALKSIAAADGVAVPEYLLMLLLMSSYSDVEGSFYIDNRVGVERLLSRSGHSGSTSNAGLGYGGGNNARSHVHDSVGFPLAFINDLAS